ncbi:MAG TPA: inorganic pyrophosphatase [Myxococcaceae bacterium]|nr:inorganic pyrophosphatase [Myxococcaceae bacterium]
MSAGNDRETLERLLAMRFSAHPWHGVPIGDRAPDEVTVYVEIVPTDAIKYELDKGAGHLRIDRPQLYSSFSPTLYGFIPQTYCGTLVGERCAERTGRTHVDGDGDPMDICVLSERDVSHSGVLLRARPIGGLRMIDGNQADDKLIAVLAGDTAFGHLQDVNELPPGMLDRFRHYFLTYKQMPGEKRPVEIPEVYDRAEAQEMVRRSQADYAKEFGHPSERVRMLLSLLGLDDPAR